MSVKECTLNGKKGYQQTDAQGNEGECFTYNDGDWVAQNEALSKAQHDLLRFAQKTTTQP